MPHWNEEMGNLLEQGPSFRGTVWKHILVCEVSTCDDAANGQVAVTWPLYPNGFQSLTCGARFWILPAAPVAQEQKLTSV